MATVVTVIGLLTVAEYTSGLNLGIDQLLAREPPDTFRTSYPGRMALAAAILLALAGTALLCLDARSRRSLYPAQ